MKRTIYSFKRLSFSFVFLFVFCELVNAQPYTAFDPGDEPTGGVGGAAANRNDPGPEAIETGVKFTVSQPGNINGVRFYKGTSNTGAHVGQLWLASGGGPLRTVTFTGESASGWQQQNFGTAYHVTTGVTYIASVYMPTGTYAADGNFSGPHINDGITLVCNCDSPNGVFDVTTTGPLTSPPSSSFGGANYWIDISFTPDFPLPVTLTAFKATPNNNNIMVSWKTTHEFNNKGFELQRSNNGSDWYPVTFINGVQGSTEVRSYNYNDKGLAPGTYFYRVNQIDLDGKSSFTEIVSATIGGKGVVSLFQNYPNPFNGITSIRFDLPRTQHIRLSVVDLSGREVRVLTDKTGQAGSHIVNLSSANLSKQTYIIRLQTENAVLTKKITVQ